MTREKTLQLQRELDAALADPEALAAAGADPARVLALSIHLTTQRRGWLSR